MEGWIKLHRGLLDSQIFASEKGLKIWVWILLKANHKERFVPIKIGRGESILNVKRGSFIFGRFSAEEELCIDGSTIYKWIKKMEELGMIELESNSHYTILTVCKFNEYNDLETEKVTAVEQPSSNQVAAVEQPCNTDKNVKNVKKVKNEEEKKENKIFSFKNSCLDLGIDADVLDDWLKLRKTKKATNSETAFNSIKSQIEKAFLSPTNCIEIAVIKSWVGFEAKWLNNIDYKSLLGNKVTLISTPPETQFNRNYNQTQNNSTYGSTYRTPGVEIERGAIQF